MNFDMRFNRRGQLGKIVSANVVLISLVFLMAIYLVLVGFAIGIKKPTVYAVIEDVGLGSVLFREINVNGERMSFVGGLINADIYFERDAEIQDSLRRASGDERAKLLDESRKYTNYMGKVKEALKSTLEKENSGKEEEICFMLFQGPGNVIRENIELDNNGKDIYYRFKNGKGEASNKVIDMEFYYKEGHFVKLHSFIVKSNVEKEYDIMYYYGRCLDEK